MSIYNHEPLPAPGTNPSADLHGHLHGSHDDDEHHRSHSHGSTHGHSHHGGSSSSAHAHSHSHGSHGDISAHAHGHSHGSHEDINAHAHGHSHGVVGHERNLKTITEMITDSDLPTRVKRQSIRVFTKLAEAEATVHGTSIDEVHFHEVGAIDSIIDVIGSVLALNLLNVEDVYCSPLPYGLGMVKTAHGVLPVPSPATLDLLRGVPTRKAPCEPSGELVTPTGAALMVALATSFSTPPTGFIPSKHGFGAGTKEFATHPNVVRVVIGSCDNGAVVNATRPTDKATDFIDASAADLELSNTLPLRSLLEEEDEVEDFALESFKDTTKSQALVIETNIDDTTPQTLALVQELLIDAGANDVWIVHCTMKKGRGDAVVLNVLCDIEKLHEMMELIYTHTPTIGVRVRRVLKFALSRQMKRIHTSYGDFDTKVATLDGVVVNVQPEFEHLKRISSTSGIPFKRIYDMSRESTSHLWK